MSTGYRKQMKEDDDDRKAPTDDKLFADVDDNDEEEHPLVWIPKKLVSEWKNKDGIRCLTLIIQLTGGAATSDNDGVEVKVSNNGEEFAISEVWSPLMSQIDDFYTYFTKSADETDDEFNRRKYAMEDNVQSILVEGPMTSIALQDDTTLQSRSFCHEGQVPWHK
jgi:hypothetical protein